MARVTRKIIFYLISQLALAGYVYAQTTTYHLHKEASTTANLFQLKTANPDGTTLAVSSVNLKNLSTGEYIIKAFDTPTGVPNASGVIPAGSTITFTLWLKKSANFGTMYPRAKLQLNSASGTLIATATGSTQLTTTLTKYTLTATTASNINVASADRFYLWVGVNLTATATSNTTASLNVEGTLNGNYDSTVAIPAIVPQPAISSLAPTSGAVGASITVTGSNFGATQGAGTITFNGISATPTSWNNTTIVAAVPANATTGPVVVTSNGLTSNAVTFTVTPKINSLSPTSGAVGAAVTISGTTFGATQGTSTVKFNGTTASPTSWSATSIVAPVPSGASTGNVVVTVAGVQSNGVTFTVNTPGTVSGKVTKADGTTPVAGATVKALQGLTALATVATNGTGDYTLAPLDPATYAIEASAAGYATKNQNPVTVNSGATTTVNLSLDAIIAGPVSYIYDATGRLISAIGPTETVNYSYDAVGNLLSVTRQSSGQLSIINVVPGSGPIGTTVTINGSGFSGVASENTVQFNGVAAAITSATPNRIVTTVPAGVPNGPIQISLTTPAGTVTTPFTVVPGSNQPAIEVTPGNISVAPGDQVQFTATVTGLANQSVTWSVNGVDGGNVSVGTISASGLYSSLSQPTSNAIYTIRATSVADPTVFGQAQVATLNPAYTQAIISNGISVYRPVLSATAIAQPVSVRKNSSTVVSGVASTGLSVRKSAPITNTPTAPAVSIRRTPPTLVFGSTGANVSLTTGPHVQTVSPATGTKGTTFTVTITGANLQGATGLKFITTGGVIDSNITATDVTVNTDGTSLTATVTINATAALGRRIVVVTTSANHSLAVDVNSNTIEVIQ